MTFDDKYLEYCARDALSTLYASDTILADMEEARVDDFYWRIPHPLSQIVGKMNRIGVWVDVTKRDIASEDLKNQIGEKERELNELAGREINASGDSLREWLYTDLKLPVLTRKKSPKPSTDKNVLKNLATRFPELEAVFDLVISIRNLKKLDSTYVEVTSEGDEFGRVHPAFRIGPVTGRLSCKRPPFQGYPKGLARSIYAAPPGRVFVGADYKQLELRIFAILGQCRALLEAFARGEDPHDANARTIYAIPPGVKVESIFRKCAKNYIFGTIYGGSTPTLTRAVSAAFEQSGQHVDPLVVAVAMQRFFDANPEAEKFMNSCKEQVLRTRMQYNNFGRLRIFFGPRKDILGQSMNNPIQSGAADLINDRMIRMDRRITWSTLLLQVHDFVLYECDEDDVERTKVAVQEEMEAPTPEFGGYSFPVDIQVGRNWAEV